MTAAMVVLLSLGDVAGAAAAGRGSSRHDLGVGDYTYYDALKPHGRSRGNDEEHADTYACDGGDSNNIGTPSFNACMRSRGWRFAHFEPARPSPRGGGGVPDWAWTCPFANC